MWISIAASTAVGFISSFIMFRTKKNIFEFINNKVDTLNDIIYKTKYVIVNLPSFEQRLIDMETNVEHAEQRIINMETNVEQRIINIETDVKYVSHTKQPREYATQSMFYVGAGNPIRTSI